MKAGMQKGIEAVMAAKGGHDLQERVGQQVRARLDGAKMAGLTVVRPSYQAPKNPALS